MQCICHSVENSHFNLILSEELKISLTIEKIVNESQCVSIELKPDESIEHALETNEILSSFEQKMGIYHLWIDQEYCSDHFDHKMLCIYVGKGYVKKRVKDHLSKKFSEDKEIDETIYVSFFECENRIAKYLEQLFLDIYKLHLNEAENRGDRYLHTMWDEGRVTHGTELHAQAEALARKYPDVFNLPE